MPASDPASLLEPCYVCLGMTNGQAMMLSLWDSISQAIAIDPVADFIARAGITEQTEIDAVQALYDAAVANGWWNKCDLIYPFVGGTAQAHAQNLKSSNFTITWNGTVTHDANGITGDGATGYGDTGYLPSSSSILTLDSAHIGIYRRSAGANGRRYSGASTLAGDAFSFTKGIAAFFSTATNTSSGGASVSSAVMGWSVGSRNDAADQHLFHNGVDNSAVSASSSVPNLSVYVLALDDDGLVSGLTNANLAGLTAGSGLSFAEYQLMAADWAAFQTALGR